MWIAIWIAIQKMYPITWDIHCSIQQITVLFIVQSLLHRYPPNIWIKIIQIVIQIKCLHGTFYDLDWDLDGDPDNCAQCKQGISKPYHKVRSEKCTNPDIGSSLITLQVSRCEDTVRRLKSELVSSKEDRGKALEDVSFVSCEKCFFSLYCCQFNLTIYKLTLIYLSTEV